MFTQRSQFPEENKSAAAFSQARQKDTTTMPSLHSKLLVAALAGSLTLSAAESAGRFVPIFDGVSLKGWEGNPKLWSVEEGAIVGRTTENDPIPANSFLIWREGVVDDFELRFEFMIKGGNSGVQYRSIEKPREWGPHILGGLQADFEAGERHTGGLYGERSRRILARRGEKAQVGTDGKPTVTGSLGDPAELQSLIDVDGWNSFAVLARGNRYIHKINGHVMVDVTDNDPNAPVSGLLGLQVHRGPPMTVKFRKIELKRLKMAGRHKVVFIGGVKSHGFASHEHTAGIKLLMHALNENFPEVHSVAYFDGHPTDPTALDNADAVVLYSNGGLGHPWLHALRQVDALAARKAGIGAIHFAVELPQGDPGARFLDWIGGYFERWWSVNPHWTIKNPKLAEGHPITNGVEPFEINDEWYFHMRFRQGMQGVTPILQAIPPRESMNRPDGPASGNPYARAAVNRREPQTLMWASERPQGGRGFGFTGGHVHWNWAHPGYRKLVLNAIAWIAGADVPSDGIDSGPYSMEDMLKNQDFVPSGRYDLATVEEMIEAWSN